jgi:GTPase SAR1 family protein
MNQQNASTTFNVAMIGASNSGKTSIVAAMFESFERVALGSNLHLTPDIKTSIGLRKKLDALIGLPYRFQEMPPTFEQENYKFAVGPKDNILNLSFTDYPGGHISGYPKEVQIILENSYCIIITIDAVALMESEGQWSGLHDVRNEAETIISIIREVCKDTSHKRLIMLCPTKCEKYMQGGKPAELADRVMEKYQKLLQYLKEKENDIAVVIAPVQTVGTVHFDKLEPIDTTKELSMANYKFTFKRVGEDPNHYAFQPTDADQPLRYILSFILHIAMEKKREVEYEAVLEGFRDVIITLTKGWLPDFIQAAIKNSVDEFTSFVTGMLTYNDPEFLESIRILTSGCKDVSPFKIIQGKHLVGK